MKVADSSYLIEGILRDATLLENETFVSPDLAWYEVVNALWKHETLIRDLKNSKERIELLSALVSNESIQLIRPDRNLLDQTYALSVKHGLAIYDSVFITLALQLKMELATFDNKQSSVLSQER
ncbi:MAG: type II toxin-antitoxin system VapC family toxin [Candidatus Bathyarchaeia archaeon]